MHLHLSYREITEVSQSPKQLPIQSRHATSVHVIDF
jgi:hypothetical protein